MKILCLYNNEVAAELFEWLGGMGHEVVPWSDRLEVPWCVDQHFDLTVSYTYRYILSHEILGTLNFNAVNLHNSYLPFNRGADPNLWSILTNSPRGVTLHYMDASLDKGAVIAQQILPKAKGCATLRTTYDELDAAAKKLFKTAFNYYDQWAGMRKTPCAHNNVGRPGAMGSYHSLADGSAIKDAIEEYGGYDINVRRLREVYEELTGQKLRGNVTP